MPRSLLMVCCLFLLSTGCNRVPKSPKTKVYPVSGKVLRASGEPLSGCVITFSPKSPPGNEAKALLERDGSFHLGTFGKDDGAIPGQYVVSIGPIPGKPMPEISRIYLSEDTSPLKVEVKEEEQVLQPFRLQ